jgi:DNA (cytosine-5-)-methyltransferase
MEINTFFDFCSGIGGGRLGLERCGLTCIGSSDTSRLANNTYNLLFNERIDKNYGNLKKINCNEIPDFDVMIAGFPCQTFSVIGRQEGTKDPRGQIIYNLIDILKKKKPKVFIFENVKGLVTHDKGKTFEKILISLSETGYSVFYKILNSIDFGVPHMRQRIYIIGFDEAIKIDKLSWPQPKERVEIRNFFNPTDNYMSDDDFEWFSNKYLNNEKNMGKFRLSEILEMENIVIDTRMSDLRLYRNRMPTLRAHRDGIYYVCNKKIYYLKGTEALKFQGFEDDRIDRVAGIVSNRHLLQQAGNAMTANVIQSIGEIILKTLREKSNELEKI